MHDVKKVGDYEATVHFHKDVEVKIPVKVIAENASAKATPTETVTEEEVAKEEETLVEE